MDFEGRSAFVVGGTAGTGLHVARMLSEGGARVTVSGRHEPCGIPGADWICADYASHGVEGLLENGGADALARCDVLVVCFGPFVQKPLHQTAAADWRLLSLCDYALPGAAVSAALPGMMARAFGRIVLFGGTRTDAVRPYRTNAAYAGAKTGVSVLVKSTAACYASCGITCNAVLPGFTHGAPPGTECVAEETLAAHALYLLSRPELNGVLLTVDRGWNP